MRVLILGGTTEGSALARALAGDARFDCVLSYAGRTRTPRLPPVPCRIGGFGGVQGLATYLRDQKTDIIVDATHPFAARMTHNAIAAAAACGVKFLRIDRPPWQPQSGDRWLVVPNMQAAARALGQMPRRVLLTIGQKDLAPFAAAPWHHYLIRSVDPPAAEMLPAGAEIITATGPFDGEDERRLLAERRIEVLVTKNSGGTATQAKLSAARAAGCDVVMVERPPSPATVSVPDVAAALEWLDHQEETVRGV
jgi:precorrin-6A/cobalt-precorrin-6A reductase